MINKISIVNSEHEQIISALKNYFTQKDIEVSFVQDLSEVKDNEFVFLIDYNSDADLNIVKSDKIFNLHFSLLPAFAQNEALQKAFISGVKVSGITIHKVKSDNFYGQIIAQYPVLIGNAAHFDEYKNEIIKLGANIYPIVIDAVINDRVFDFADLFKTSCANNDGCNGNCSGCSGSCKH